MTTLKPTLRFSEFTEDWEVKTFGNIFSFRSTNSFSRENLNYLSGSIKNIHYGDIHTKFKTLFNICNEVVPFINEEINLAKIPETNYCQEGDLIIADASEDYADIGKCIEIVNLNNEKTLAGLHTFIARPDLYKMSSGFSGFIMQSRNIRLQIMTIAQGSKVLGISTGRLSNIFLNIPPLPEQTKIANFLTATDQKIEAFKEKKSLIQEYKKGIMQQLFSQQLRFKNNNSEDYPEWEYKSLGEVLYEHKTRNLTKDVNEVFSVAKEKGVINQIEHLGRSYASEETSNYKVAFPNDIIYTKSPTSDFPFGIIKQNKLNRKGIVSVLYAVFKPENKTLGLFLDYYFSIWQNTYNYLNPLVQKGAKNTMNIGNSDFLNGSVICLPSSEEEQIKIANFLTAIDEKIEKINQQITDTQTFKKGLLQQMFC